MINARKILRPVRYGLASYRRGLFDVVSFARFRFADQMVYDTGKVFDRVIASYTAPIINPPAQRHLFENKINNLTLASKKLNGLLIRPGQIFSFWARIGSPDETRGYREASAFVDYKVTSVMGGSLCQLSGVLYNIALLGNFQILERHAHSIDAYGEARYIPLGRDATIVPVYKDLRFRNTLPCDVLLSVEIHPDRVSAELRTGGDLDFPEISIESVTVAKQKREEILIKDPSLSEGERIVERDGCDGRTVITYRMVHQPDGNVLKEYLCTDTYKHIPRIIRIK